MSRHPVGKPAGRSATVAIVLAAGAGARFGAGIKVLADLGGRPVLQHVLDRLAAGGIGRFVVVLGEAADAIVAAVAWPAGTERVVNPRPGDGLASSLRLGMDAARSAGDPPAILVALGDQPRMPSDVVSALLAAPPDRPVVVPHYAGDANPNPVLLRPAAYDLVVEARGDRGLGPVLRAHPELVHEVPVVGANPDVDTPADLADIRASASRVP